MFQNIYTVLALSHALGYNMVRVNCSETGCEHRREECDSQLPHAAPGSSSLPQISEEGAEAAGGAGCSRVCATQQLKLCVL